jgi:hypothetical protein
MIVNRTLMTLLPLVAALLLVGCWTPPRADVQPQGPSRLIQEGIVVKSALRLAIVRSVDPDTRRVVMQVPGATQTQGYKASPQLSGLNRLTAGAKVRATVTEEFTVYVSSDGRLPGSDAVSTTLVGNAKVLLTDPSYRLLTLQYPDGQTQTFKVAREVKLKQMQPGDDVIIQPLELVSLSVRRR